MTARLSSAGRILTRTRDTRLALTRPRRTRVTLTRPRHSRLTLTRPWHARLTRTRRTRLTLTGSHDARLTGAARASRVRLARAGVRLTGRRRLARYGATRLTRASYPAGAPRGCARRAGPGLRDLSRGADDAGGAARHGPGTTRHRRRPDAFPAGYHRRNHGRGRACRLRRSGTAAVRGAASAPAGGRVSGVRAALSGGPDRSGAAAAGRHRAGGLVRVRAAVAATLVGRRATGPYAAGGSSVAGAEGLPFRAGNSRHGPGGATARACGTAAFVTTGRSAGRESGLGPIIRRAATSTGRETRLGPIVRRAATSTGRKSRLGSIIRRAATSTGRKPGLGRRAAAADPRESAAAVGGSATVTGLRCGVATWAIRRGMRGTTIGRGVPSRVLGGSAAGCQVSEAGRAVRGGMTAYPVGSSLAGGATRRRITTVAVGRLIAGVAVGHRVAAGPGGACARTGWRRAAVAGLSRIRPPGHRGVARAGLLGIAVTGRLLVAGGTPGRRHGTAGQRALRGCSAPAGRWRHARGDGSRRGDLRGVACGGHAGCRTHG
ncbi:hypothetical protein AB0368_14300 [Actinoplanes sp. NPDC051475]|uniref:hypothetical protein n=1 Tax=Actinoplanes sp. NPDC051475 TaxID=3157225 RepID=UPI00344EAACB